MKEAVIGFIGVIVGSIVPWLQSLHSAKNERDKHAHYLAIRVIIALRQYTYACWLVAVDDGLNQGERDIDGCLVPQAKDPGPIVYPNDIEWKSIDAQLAYDLLSLQLDAESADRSIAAAIEFTDGPPDYEDIFEERHSQYSKIGLKVIDLENRLCKKFEIPLEDKNSNWSPLEDFNNAIKKVEQNQNRRAENNKSLFDEMSRFTNPQEDK